MRTLLPLRRLLPITALLPVLALAAASCAPHGAASSSAPRPAPAAWDTVDRALAYDNHVGPTPDRNQNYWNLVEPDGNPGPSQRIFLSTFPRPWDENDPEVALVYALWRTVALRDADTGRHSDRVRALAACLADGLRQRRARLGGAAIPKDFVRLMYYAAALHDFGKIGVSDAILLKPGALTDEEREAMHLHPGLGGVALADIGWAWKVPNAALVFMEDDRRYWSLLSLAAAVAGGHHKRWDGTGYPEGLAGADIPLGARIMAVADVYDALAHARVYKPAWPRKDCAKAIREGAGTHFDPEIVAVFEEREADFRRLLGLDGMDAP